MKNVLIINDINFWEESSGHRARLKALITFLSHNVNLTVINTGPAQKGIEVKLREKYSVEFYVLEHKNFMSSNGYGRRLEKLIRNRLFDTVIIEYIHSTFFLNFINGEPKLILDAHDIISERTEEFKKFNYAGALFELNAERELEILNVYDHVMAICGPDKKKLDDLIGPDKVLLCPHPVEVSEHPFRDVVKTISFIASAYLPNRDAINNFIQKCWPTIVAQCPQLQLNVYGSICSEVQTNGMNNIVLKGFATDLQAVYREADIMINPVRFGAGMKIKTIEALAHGVPLVTTTHGSRGVESASGKAYLQADSHAELVNALKLLIEDNALRKKMGIAGVRFAKENFKAEQCFESLLKVIAEI